MYSRQEGATERPCILFDNDGVLVDTEYWYYQATRETIAELGIELELENYLQRMVDGLSSWELAIASGVSEQDAIAKRKERDVRYQAFLQEQDIEIPGVLDVLRCLSRHCRMAIVTTAKGKDFDIIHRDRGIVDHMDFVLVREDYQHSKPNPEPYLLAMDKFSARSEDCLIVEDSQRGLKAAMAAGIDCAVVYNKFTESQDFSGASHRIQTLAELPGLVRMRENQE